MVNVGVAVTAVLYNKYFEDVFGQNRAEYRNRENDITGLQTNRIYCNINGLKTLRILIKALNMFLWLNL